MAEDPEKKEDNKENNNKDYEKKKIQDAESRIVTINVDDEKKEKDDSMDSIEKAFGDDNNEIKKEEKDEDKKEDKKEEENEEKYDEFEIKEKKSKLNDSKIKTEKEGEKENKEEEGYNDFENNEVVDKVNNEDNDNANKENEDNYNDFEEAKDMNPDQNQNLDNTSDINISSALSNRELSETSLQKLKRELKDKDQQLLEDKIKYKKPRPEKQNREKRILSIEEVKEKTKKIKINSPRSLKVMHHLNYKNEDLFYYDFKTFLKVNTKIVGDENDIKKKKYEIY